jgi:hypothetical protein
MMRRTMMLLPENEDGVCSGEFADWKVQAYEYEEFDGENRMDQPGFWYGQPDVNDEECEG